MTGWLLWLTALVVLSAALTWAMRREHKRNQPRRYGWMWTTSVTTGQMYTFTPAHQTNSIVNRLDGRGGFDEPSFKYVDDEKFRRVLARVMERDAELLRRLGRKAPDLPGDGGDVGGGQG